MAVELADVDTSFLPGPTLHGAPGHARSRCNVTGQLEPQVWFPCSWGPGVPAADQGVTRGGPAEEPAQGAGTGLGACAPIAEATLCPDGAAAPSPILQQHRRGRLQLC